MKEEKEDKGKEAADLLNLKDGRSLFWNEFLAECRLFENCTVQCCDGAFRTHKVLLFHNLFLRQLLSKDDPGEESTILLPDFTLEVVTKAFDFNNKDSSEFSSLFGSLSELSPIGINPQTNNSEAEENSQVTNQQLNQKYLQYLTPDGKFGCAKCSKVFESLRFLHKHEETYHRQSAKRGKKQLEDTLDIADEILPSKENKAQKKRPWKKRKATEMEDFIVDERHDDDEDFKEEYEGDSDPLSLSQDDEERKKKPRKKTTSTETSAVQCTVCDKGFPTQTYLDSHMTSKHPEKSEINSLIEEKDGKYRCLLCQKTFSTARRCRYHLKLKHKIGAKLSCDQCSKKFYYEYDLQLHKRFHNPERSYVCDLCGKGFLLDSVLQSHKYKMHSTREEKEKGRKFVCSFCAKGFFSKAALQEHELLHSEKKNFHCELCGLSFKQSSGLRAHNGRHHKGPKVVSEEKKVKMRNYMKKYRAMKAGKLPNVINTCYRNDRKAEETEQTAGMTAVSAADEAGLPTAVITIHHPSLSMVATNVDDFKGSQAAFKLEEGDGREYATKTYYI